MKELKLGTASVRGVVGEALTPELIVNFACAFGSWAEGGGVVIGRDTRRSSPMLRSAVVSGLLSPGCEVIDLGVCSTPLVSFAVRELGAAGGIVITGSHNDARWNALKFIGPDGALLNSVKSEELLDIYHASAFRAAPRDRLQSVSGVGPDVSERYLAYLLACLDAESIHRRGFRVVVDFCSGACAALTEAFFRLLGCTLVPLNSAPTGRFPHPPAPSKENMTELCGAVREVGADLGAAFNVDGDRIGFVCPDGRALSEEYSLVLAAQSRLARRAGLVVTSFSTSRMVEAVADQYGQKVIRAAVGESHIIDRGLSEGAVLSGEGSGGVAALPISMTFDALLTLGMVMEALALGDVTLTTLADRFPKYHMRKGTVAGPPAEVYRAVDDFRRVFAERNPSSGDGVRVDWKDTWLHIRASNTEPLLRIIAESESEERVERVFQDAKMRAEQMISPRYKED